MAVDLNTRETILLTEDHGAVRWIVAEVLQREGYTVLVAKDGEEALRLSEGYAAPIHVLVSDFMMPHMNGRQLAECLKPLRPDMKVLFLSGHAEGVADQEGLPGREAPFLQKPFVPDVLTRKVREVLDR